jgi:predicted GH43/DUF377 family glycosyl hydrolase
MHKKFKWQRYKGNPIFPTISGTWMESQTANPDLLEMGDRYFMYFRGQQAGHDRIGLATIPKNKFDGKTWNILPEPILDVGKPGDWDETHVLDPAAVVVDGKVYLYYSAVCPTCDRSICLATSEDGIDFQKYQKNPVLIGGGPEIVSKDGIFYLFYWKPGRSGQGFEIHLSTSRDGFNFKKNSKDPVLSVGETGTWDSHTVETPRIFLENGIYYMLYCGSDRYDDYPWHAGLATSHDLVKWKKYENNPVFSRGETDDWDEGAIWFTTVEKTDGIYYMWYEGYGGGTARWEPYGTYLKGGKSQVGMATLEADYFYMNPFEN